MLIQLYQRLALLCILLFVLCHTINSQRYSDDFYKHFIELFPEDSPDYFPSYDSGIVDGLVLALQKFQRAIVRQKIMIPNLVPAEKVEYFNENSTVVADLALHSALARTANCRDSLDLWDCEDCKKVLPDGKVVRTFGTYPLQIVGQVILSLKKKTIYVMIRNENSRRNQELLRLSDLVDHSFIPKAKVHRGIQEAVNDIKDIVISTLNMQTRLHPTFRVHVMGHSFGAAVASLLTVEIEKRVPRANSKKLSSYLIGKPRVGNEAYAQYVRDRNLDIKRLVHLSDLTNEPPRAENDGYTHEGTEYWEYAIEPSRILRCVGARESRDCVNTVELRTLQDHMMSMGTDHNCKYLGG